MSCDRLLLLGALEFIELRVSGSDTAAGWMVRVHPLSVQAEGGLNVSDRRPLIAYETL